MSNLFDASDRIAYVQKIASQMASAVQLLNQFTNTVAGQGGVASNWAAYAATYSGTPSAEELLEINATRAKFEAKASALKDSTLVSLASALAVIAGACPNGTGGYLTLQELCDQLVAALPSA